MRERKVSIGEGQYLAFGQGSSSGSPENPEAYKFSSNLKTLPFCDETPTNSQNLCAKPLAASGERPLWLHLQETATTD